MDWRPPSGPEFFDLEDLKSKKRLQLPTSASESMNRKKKEDSARAKYNCFKREFVICSKKKSKGKPSDELTTQELREEYESSRCREEVANAKCHSDSQHEALDCPRVGVV